MTVKNNNIQYSTKELAYIYTAMNKGVSKSIIAKELGRTPGAVRKQYFDLINNIDGKLTQVNNWIEQVGEVEVNHRKIEPARKAMQKWSVKEMAQAYQLYQNGHTYPDIAKKMDRSYSSVNNILHMLKHKPEKMAAVNEYLIHPVDFLNPVELPITVDFLKIEKPKSTLDDKLAKQVATKVLQALEQVNGIEAITPDIKVMIVANVLSNELKGK